MSPVGRKINPVVRHRPAPCADHTWSGAMMDALLDKGCCCEAAKSSSITRVRPMRPQPFLALVLLAGLTATSQGLAAKRLTASITAASIRNTKHIFDGRCPVFADVGTCVRRSLRGTDRLWWCHGARIQRGDCLAGALLALAPASQSAGAPLGLEPGPRSVRHFHLQGTGWKTIALSRMVFPRCESSKPAPFVAR